MVQMKLSTKASQSKMKKCSEATQTLRTGCSKVDPQTNTQINRQGQLQYTAQLSAQCNNLTYMYMLYSLHTKSSYFTGTITWTGKFNCTFLFLECTFVKFYQVPGISSSSNDNIVTITVKISV